jgi:hypothetical protein
MPAPKKPVTFDEHLGALVGGFAKPYGGRPYLKSLLDWSMNTVNRRISGTHGFTVQELEVVAAAIGTDRDTLIDQALKNYSGESAEAGLEKLIEDTGATLIEEPIQEAPSKRKHLDAAPRMSDAPVSIEEKRKTKAHLTEEMARQGRHAANYDPEHTEDDDLRDD